MLNQYINSYSLSDLISLRKYRCDVGIVISSGYVGKKAQLLLL